MKLHFIKPFFIIIACLFSSGILAQIPDFSMIGFATLNGGTTGGEGGQVVTPTNLAELKQYVENASTPYIIRIDKEFNTGVQTWVDADGGIVNSGDPGAIETTFGAILKVGSNKTLIGIDDQGFWIPLTGLIDGLRGVWNVFVIGEDNQVERRSVQVLFANNQQAYVTGAISEGEQVIESGLHRLVPGQTVSPLQLASK